MSGASFTVKVDRVVDGDTVRVFLSSEAAKSEKLRILTLDTEEVEKGDKPKTRMGDIASARASALIPAGSMIKLILPGDGPLEEAKRKYRGNTGRLLVYIELPDGRDFQEVMIREGMSPYFIKYGYAHWPERHHRYLAAERSAQMEMLGVWDQFGNNGREERNYAALGCWWDLRAKIIDSFRDLRRRSPDAPVFNTRVDYERLTEIAAAGGEATVFTELRDMSVIDENHIVFRPGSRTQPFQLWLPNANRGDNAEVLNLLRRRYLSEGERRPRRGYAYVRGPLRLFRGAPEMEVTRPDQISDDWRDGEE
ncbi:MAG: thermonuclease family protein [Neomegalonema sp.]|nr:thermonuclease family protein [Neomegalonema sp.]